jgi:hypothetical protein
MAELCREFAEHSFQGIGFLPNLGRKCVAQLAKAKSAILATLDERIPGAFLIPTQR